MLDVDRNVSDPRQWNRYAYATNNPLRFVDPDGRAFWDLVDFVSAAASVVEFIAQPSWKNAGKAALDIGGAALPIIPSPGTVRRVVQAADAVADGAKAARRGETAATKAGKEAHKEFAEKVSAKEGWQSEPTIKGPKGETLKPDALSPSGRPVELKPDTPSGRKAGEKQLKKYEEATGKKGRVVYHDVSSQNLGTPV